MPLSSRINPIDNLRLRSFINIPQGINLLFFGLLMFFNVTIKTNDNLWKYFGDSPGYLALSQVPLISSQFYFPNDSIYEARPFTVPLFYKIASGDSDKCIKLQKFMHAFSTFFLVSILLLFIKRRALQYILIASIYLLMSWWSIVGWSIVILSESLSISLMFIWIASFLLFLKKRNRLTLIIHLLITMLFSFTRDNTPYIILSFYFLFVLVTLLWNKAIFKYSLIMFVFVLSIFFMQEYGSVHQGRKYKIALFNEIIVRVLPNPEYIQWYKNEGMPCIDTLEKKYGGLSDNKDRGYIYKSYSDSSLAELSTWVLKRGMSVFTKFLITHPYHTFLFDQTPEERKRIFAYNVGYTGPLQGFNSTCSEYIFPLFNFLSVIFLNILLVIIFIRSRSVIYLFLPLLSVVFAINAILSYDAGGGLEVERHLIFTNIIMQFIGILGSILIIDSISMRLKSKEINTEHHINH